MSRWKETAGAFALGLALIATASPGLANERAHHASAQDWRNARAEAVGDGFGPGDRAAALRDCAGKTDKLKEYTWGEETDMKYRACMSERGQPE